LAQVFLATIVRTKFAQVITPGILFNILLIVICSNAPHFPNTTVIRSFLSSLSKAVFLGLGIGTGVSLFILPISLKSLVVKQLSGLMMGVKAALNAYRTFIFTLGDEERVSEALLDDQEVLPYVSAVNSAFATVSAANSKLQVDLSLAKREIGVDMFGPAELKGINKCLRLVIIPMLGLNSVADVLKNFSRSRGWRPGMELNEEEQALRAQAIKEWASNMRLVRDSVDSIIGIMIEAIDHIQIKLSMTPKPKKALDLEGASAGDAPGGPAFAGRLDRISTEFYSTKHRTLIDWAKMRGVDIPEDFFVNPDGPPINIPDSVKKETIDRHQQNQRQLYVLLYVSEQLL
jgi:Putative ER transporter, 6TM, N-terminal